MPFENKYIKIRYKIMNEEWNDEFRLNIFYLLIRKYSINYRIIDKTLPKKNRDY